MKFWQRLFTSFLQRFHLMRFFGRNRSFKELHQSSYAQEISKNLSKRLLNASRAQTNDLLKTIRYSFDGAYRRASAYPTNDGGA